VEEFGYDGFNENGAQIPGLSNSIGRLSHSSNETDAAATYSYDPMGRTTLKSLCRPGDCSYDINVEATYDLAGDVAMLTNGSALQPITFTYGYDNADRLDLLSSNWSPNSNHPATLLNATPASWSGSSPAYGRIGLENAYLGVNSSTQAPTVTMARTYDARQRLDSEPDDATAVLTSPATQSSGSISVSGSEASYPVVESPPVGATGWASVNAANSTPADCIGGNAFSSITINGAALGRSPRGCVGSDCAWIRGDAPQSQAARRIVATVARKRVREREGGVGCAQQRRPREGRLQVGAHSVLAREQDAWQTAKPARWKLVVRIAKA